MKFLPLSIITIILIAALAGNVWFWLNVFNEKVDTPLAMEQTAETSGLCVEFLEVQTSVSCDYAISLTIAQFPGKVDRVDLAQWSDLLLPPDFDTRFGTSFWKIGLFLQGQVQYFELLVRGEIEVLVDVDTGRIILYKISTVDE